MSVSVQDNAGATQPFGQEVPPSDQNGFVYYVRAFFVRIFTIIGSICSMVGKIFLFLIPKRKTEPASSHRFAYFPEAANPDVVAARKTEPVFPIPSVITPILPVITPIVPPITTTLSRFVYFPEAANPDVVAVRKTEPVSVPFPRIKETGDYQNSSARMLRPGDMLVNLLTNIENIESTRPLTPSQHQHLCTARGYITENTSICHIEICSVEIKDIRMEPVKNDPYPPEYDDPEFDRSQYDCPWTIIPTVLGIMTIYPIHVDNIPPNLQKPLHHKIYRTQTDATVLNEISDLREHGMSIPCQLSIGNKKEEECHNYPSCVFLTRNAVYVDPQTKQIRSNYILADIMSVFFRQASNSGAKKVYIAIEIGDDSALSNEDKEQIFTQAIQGIMLYLLHFAQTKRIELIMEQIIFLTFPHNDPVLYSDESLRSSMACIKPFLTAESPIFENN